MKDTRREGKEERTEEGYHDPLPVAFGSADVVDEAAAHLLGVPHRHEHASYLLPPRLLPPLSFSYINPQASTIARREPETEGKKRRGAQPNGRGANERERREGKERRNERKKEE